MIKLETATTSTSNIFSNGAPADDPRHVLRTPRLPRDVPTVTRPRLEGREREGGTGK